MPAGTPSRIAKLLADGSLSLSACSLFVVDVHADCKSFTILSHPSLRSDFFALYREHIHPAVVAGKLKLALY